MKHQLGLSLVVLAVLSVPPVWAQTDTDQSQSGSGGQSQGSSPDQTQGGSTSQPQGGSTDQSQQSSTGPQVAYTHPEQLPPLTMLNEVTANTGITLSMRTGVLENYQSANGSTGGYLETQGLFAGGLHITQIRPTVAWEVRYDGGTSLTSLTLPGSSSYTYLNQSAGAKALWQVAKRWQLAAEDSYIYTNDPFAPFVTINNVPTFNNPNPVIYIPQSVTEANVASLNLTYQMAAHDSLTFTGGESFQRYYNTTLASNNSFTYSAGADYQHEFSARLSAGGGYSFTAIDYGHGLSRSGIEGITGFASYHLSPTMYVSGFMGPEYTANKNIVPTFCFPGFGCFGYHAQYQSEWNLAEGATFAWSGTRNALRFGFRHQNTDGGGFLGTVRLYQVTAEYRRPLTSRWDFSTGFSYNNSRSISLYSGNGFLNAQTATVNFSRNISQSWYATVYYAAIHQSQRYALPVVSNLGTNGVGVSIQYNWNHSLGR